jgi:ADP-ribose pyrophosphatase YjhB (NUDIX family)
LKRERLEEAGNEIEILSFFHFMEHFFYVDPQDQGYHSLMFFYKARSISNAARSYETRPNNDSEEVIWVDMVDLRREDFYSPFQEVYILLH